MLEVKPGCYVFIGNGVGEGVRMIHNPGYDFNDEILTIGASYWVRLAESFLRRSSA
jgi:hippurate hydrolase